MRDFNLPFCFMSLWKSDGYQTLARCLLFLWGSPATSGSLHSLGGSPESKFKGADSITPLWGSMCVHWETVLDAIHLRHAVGFLASCDNDRLLMYIEEVLVSCFDLTLMNVFTIQIVSYFFRKIS